MRCVVQRVKKAKVTVDAQTVGKIDTGFLVLAAVHRNDTRADVEWMARKLPALRLFPDGEGKFNRSLAETGGAFLLVSQFTLYADCRKGRRPSFTDSAPPEQAQALFDELVQALRTAGFAVQTGVFGAHMQVELVNDGPVTVILDSAADAPPQNAENKPPAPSKDENSAPGAAPKPEPSNAPGTSGGKTHERPAQGCGIAAPAGMKAAPPQTAGGRQKEPMELPPVAALRGLLDENPHMLLQWALPPVLEWKALPPEHQEVVVQAAGRLKNQPEAFRDALFAVLVSPQAADGLRFFLHCGLLEAFVPELCETVNLSNEDDRRHKHVWDHTLQVVTQIAPRLELRTAALFHDIGKPPTREFTADGKVTFYGHDRAGGRIFRKIARRLHFPEDLAEHVRQLVKLHLRPGQYQPSWTDSAVRRFYRELPAGILDDLLELGRADITSKRPGRREHAVAMIDELERRIRAIMEEDAKVPPLPTGLGNAVMEAMGLKPGPQLGKIMKHLAQEVEEGRLERQAPFSHYIDYLQRLGGLGENL